MSKRNMSPLEFDEQVAFLNWFERQYPVVRIFAIPNGTRTSIRLAMKAKKEGVKKGVPDLYIPEWKVWVEMKRVSGSSVSPEQKDWHKYLSEKCGDTVIVAKGWMDAYQKIREFTKALQA